MPRNIEYQTFKDHLDNVLDSDGKLALPNVESIKDHHQALMAIAYSSPKLNKEIETPYRFRIRNLEPPLPSGQTHEVTYYPKIFLNARGMAGNFDGSGTILTAAAGYARTFTFAICEHDWDKSGANHSRGWHPARCKKCGFDASIDSGD